MDKIKFSDFDLFAYVSSGLAGLLSVDLAFGTHVVLLKTGADPSISYTVLLLIGAYVLGHIVAIPAHIVMEQVLLGSILRRPSILLFDEDHRLVYPWVKALRDSGITDYGKPLDRYTIRRIDDRFLAEGKAPVGANRYWAIYPAIYAPRDKELTSAPRIELFAKLFNFARNLATVSLFHPVVLLAAYLAQRPAWHPAHASWQVQLGGAGVLFVALSLRFLKFYDLNAREMFIAYSQGARPTRTAQRLSDRLFPARPIVGVGVAVLRPDAVLLIRRGKPPNAGAWSLPGGAQELGETMEAAARRELLEETGLTVGKLILAATVDSIHREPGGGVRFHYSIIDFAAAWTGGEPRAGGDATDIAWMAPDQADSFGLWDEARRVIGVARGLLGFGG